MQDVFQIDAFPGQSVTLLLYKDLKNSSALRQSLIDRTLHPEVALINAAVVPDLFLLHLAAYKVLVDQVLTHQHHNASVPAVPNTHR